MADHSQFISTLEKRIEPKISFKELIKELSTYTGKPYSHIADKLKNLIFAFCQNGRYTNAFVNCTVFDDRDDGSVWAYEPNSNHFKDAFDHIKGVLSDVIARNSIDVLYLDTYSLIASEIAQLIRTKSPTLLDKFSVVRAHQEISQNQNDYISVYELIEWAKSEYGNHIGDTAKDILRLLNGKQVQTYKNYTGLKARIEATETNLSQLLNFACNQNGYKKSTSLYDNFDDDIPF